ncbi:MAG: GGDEF domain-containing protein [Peptococcaceae bacterium]|nr:GGDEF domain-containing protein [Peptococcaceae bacterium]
MTKDHESALQHLALILDSLLENKPLPAESIDYAYPPEWTPLVDSCQRLQNAIDEFNAYVLALSQGNIDVEAPPRKNYLASSLKHFQAQLQHLTWQAECITQGNYNQKLDFMGTFSEVFNTMALQLEFREKQLISQQDSMKRVFDKLDPIFIVETHAGTNNAETILYANQLAQERFHLQEQTHLMEYSATLPQDIAQLPRDGTPMEFPDAENTYWYRITSSYFPWTTHHENTLLFQCVDITTQKRHAAKLEQAANTDELTKVLNRRAFEFSATHLWEACLNTSKPFSVLMFDLDYFKRCNDTYGHQFGDLCLKTFADILKKVFSRSSDIVARYGGEEFVVALPFTPGDMAILLGEKVRERLQETPIPDPCDNSLDVHLTVSIGVTSPIPEPHYPLNTLIARADQALYKAKEDGRNRVVFLEMETG